MSRQLAQATSAGQVRTPKAGVTFWVEKVETSDGPMGARSRQVVKPMEYPSSTTQRQVARVGSRVDRVQGAVVHSAYGWRHSHAPSTKTSVPSAAGQGLGV